MSVSNAQRLVTKQDLKDFYDDILPYLGGSADAGFTPVGTIISVMGVTAPVNYLACNGQTVNIADYPELADYFYQQFGSKNKFGGNGTTTFGIPDLRGEFLRGTGTNSHTDNIGVPQGNGADVGTHQDATREPYWSYDSGGHLIWMSNYDDTKNAGKLDSTYTGTSSKPVIINASNNTDQQARTEYYTTRPTNTSVLYCIATKNIYMNPSLDYSTSEKVVGTWIDGATLYQKTIVNTFPEVTTDGTAVNKLIDIGATVDFAVIANASIVGDSDTNVMDSFYANNGFTAFAKCRIQNNNHATAPNKLMLITNSIGYSEANAYVTIQYTKVT